MTPTSTTVTPQGGALTSANARRTSLIAALGAALLGVVILFGVGFSPLTVAHNAAHDARHAAGFPCH